MKGWTECLLEHSIVPIQQFAYTKGKNATDGAMIIDAMDLLYTGRFTSFCIVSSDSDFTRLAARIREQGASVYGFGNRHNTHRAFIAACTKFVYLDAMDLPLDEDTETRMLPGQTSSKQTMESTDAEPGELLGAQISSPAQPEVTTITQSPTLPLRYRHTSRTEPVRRPLDEAALSALRIAIMCSNTYEEDFVNLAEVGEYLIKVSPDLNARNFLYNRTNRQIADVTPEGTGALSVTI
ncbi:hypothetical protein LTR01_009166 [Friedmanniomyces endolithicus]|uniref:NYN domain-containing protein n=1 Tax=Friedmanniomyces endolithicus TaxID=329885 RepID=A0AAN6IZV2_9PEZI|nr:hypothetical protein LTR01_009166 [Friedmanniomyces endolithicus]KAK0302497.1 hypothetical protein LTR82_017848 [Friedmanniomyces endolithicus]